MPNFIGKSTTLRVVSQGESCAKIATGANPKPLINKLQRRFLRLYSRESLFFTHFHNTMKSSRIARLVSICLVGMMAFSLSLKAAEKKESVKVWGNCGMCKKTIEGALKGVDGISSASWDKKSKMLEVTYDDAKINLTKIEEKVASSGYDTQNAKAADAAYNGLKQCCKYDRKKS